MQKMFYSCYKGIWYLYIPQKDLWALAEDEFGNKNLCYFEAKKYRIDQCFDEFFKQASYGRIGVKQSSNWWG